MSFSNKVVLITGASSGIGADAARHFSKLSAKLVLVGRNAANLKLTADICLKNSGLEPLSIVADVSKDADIERIIDTTKRHFGRLDVLVNNAGVGAMDDILNLNMDKYDEIMNTNLRAVFNLTSKAVPLLIESKGNIINISSILGVKPLIEALTYSVSKAALNAFNKAIAIHLASKKVRVNSIALGVVHTSIQEKSGVDTTVQKNLEDSIPMGKVVDIEDVSQLIEYLASDAAKSITGHYVALDGGYISL